MSSFLVHKATILKMNGILRKKMPVFWLAGSYIDNIEADLHGPSHGAIVQKDNYSIIDDHIVPTVEKLVVAFQSRSDYDRLIRRICHYSEDSLTIGQICGGKEDGGYWGRVDDKIDAASEFVRHKGNWHRGKMILSDMGDIITYHKNLMGICYGLYYKDARKWGRVITPREVTHMTRFATCYGANIAASYVFYAYTLAGSPDSNLFHAQHHLRGIMREGITKIIPALDRTRKEKVEVRGTHSLPGADIDEDSLNYQRGYAAKIEAMLRDIIDNNKIGGDI